MMRMDEHINKNALYETIIQLEELARNRYLDAPSLYYPMYMTQLNERADFKQIITDFPTADVAPVRHGRWICRNKWKPSEFKYECSICHDGSDLESKYCPNCGAKMDGGDGNG